MTVESFLAFCAAALALALVPGPTVTVIVANSLRYGTRAGLLNVAGTQVGFVIWLVIATLGLGAAISVMGIWFDVLRWAGAAYLVFLAIRLFMSQGKMAAALNGGDQKGSFFFQGFIVIISNPKMLVLFGAMIPPFITPGGNPMLQVFLLGLTFMMIALVGDTLYALLAGKAGAWLSRSRIRALEVTSGCFLLAGGLWMALRGR